MSAKKPRAAYCTGCGTTFPKMHMMMNHRRAYHCGGRYLPQDMRDTIDARRAQREYVARVIREGESNG